MARPVDPSLRQRLLTAAAAEFAANGFAGTTMDGVGRRAGVTKGGVYFHFPGKEELFFAVLDASRDALALVLAGVRSSDASGADRLTAFLREYLVFHLSRPAETALPRVLATELQRKFTTAAREDARIALRELRQQLRELLSAGAQDGSLSAGDPALAAVLLAGALDGVLHQWLTSAQDVALLGDPARIADAMVAPYRIAGGKRRRRRATRAEADDAGFQPPF
jgi:AcrR family transcriptional regulator